MGYSIKCYTGRLCPEPSNPYPLIYYFLSKWYPFHIPQEQNAPLSCTSRISQTNRISYHRHVFAGLSPFWFSCSKGANCYVFRVVISAKIHVELFDILRLSHHFFHFAADFESLLYALVYCELKKGTPFGRSLPIKPTIGSKPLGYTV